MCGRFTLTTTSDEIAERFNVSNSFLEHYEKNYNVAPSHSVLSIIDTGEERRAGFLRWGLIPSWAKDEKIGYKLINARAETLAEKPSFKNAFKKRRCLIIADGFYEWKKQNNSKQPLRLTLKNQQLFAMAGLWEKWQTPEGNSIYSCAVITTKPNQLVSEIHDRMPAILRKQDEQTWLNRKIEDLDLLAGMLQPYSTNDMIAYPVSTQVNSPKNNSTELIVPIC